MQLQLFVQTGKGQTTVYMAPCYSAVNKRFLTLKDHILCILSLVWLARPSHLIKGGFSVWSIWPDYSISDHTFTTKGQLLITALLP